MANAKKCDMCGNYYDMPDISPCLADYERYVNEVRLHRAPESDEKNARDIWLSFDACPKCYQDVLDYILSKAAAK